jgi:hypothetical protein
MYVQNEQFIFFRDSFFVSGNAIQGNAEKLYLPFLQKYTNCTCTKIDTSTKDDNN